MLPMVLRRPNVESAVSAEPAPNAWFGAWVASSTLDIVFSKSLGVLGIVGMIKPKPPVILI